MGDIVLYQLEGKQMPAIIVGVEMAESGIVAASVDLQVFVNGWTGTLWVQKVLQGMENEQWQWKDIDIATGAA